MKIPTPSFFRIRVVALILAFFVLCFFVGFLKNAFSQAQPQYIFQCFQEGADDWQDIEYYNLNVNACTGSMTSKDNRDITRQKISRWSCKRFEINNPDAYWRQFQAVYAKSMPSLTISTSGCECPDGKTWNNETGSCEENCDDERLAKISECGGEQNVDWDTWNEETCTASCKSCDYTEYLTDRAKCPSPAMHVWDEATCTGYCKGIGNCTDEDVQNALQACGARGIAHIDATKPDCPYQCNADCQDTFTKAKIACGWYGIGDFDWETCDYSCEKCVPIKAACEQQCASRGGTAYNDCYTSPRGTVVDQCQCNDELTPPEDGDEMGENPDPPDDETPEEPGPTDPDNPNGAELVAMGDNIRKLVQQGNDRKNQLQGILNNTSWIGENNKIIANNTKLTVEAIRGLNSGLDGVADSIGDLASGIESLELGDIEIEGLDEITDGTFTPPTEQDPYVSPEHDFSQRTSDFLSNMKTTGIFSLRDQLSSSIPSGGSSTLIIEGGETYGSHTIDFADYSPAIVILRTIFNLAGMILAIRIVTLKR